MAPHDVLPLSTLPSAILPTTGNRTPANFSTVLVSTLAPLALAITLNSPLPTTAIPFPSSPAPSSVAPTTPFGQSKDPKFGLENGKIRPCPSTNPGCVSTNPKSSSFAFPWVIPQESSEDAVQRLRDAILETQKNVKFQVVEDTPDGKYLQAEIDGRFGRDVLEFLVKRDIVAYRSIAKKVTFIYPFTTALGDPKGQIEGVNKIADQLGWYAPKFEAMD